MDHMPILGTDPSLVILSQTSYSRKVQNQAQDNMDGVINPENYNISQFYHRKFSCNAGRNSFSTLVLIKRASIIMFA